MINVKIIIEFDGSKSTDELRIIEAFIESRKVVQNPFEYARMRTFEEFVSSMALYGAIRYFDDQKRKEK